MSPRGLPNVCTSHFVDFKLSELHFFLAKSPACHWHFSFEWLVLCARFCFFLKVRTVFLDFTDFYGVLILFYNYGNQKCQLKQWRKIIMIKRKFCLRFFKTLFRFMESKSSGKSIRKPKQVVHVLPQELPCQPRFSADTTFLSPLA